jgi:hypothetical protein
MIWICHTSFPRNESSRCEEFRPGSLILIEIGVHSAVRQALHRFEWSFVAIIGRRQGQISLFDRIGQQEDLKHRLINQIKEDDR